MRHSRGTTEAISRVACATSVTRRASASSARRIAEAPSSASTAAFHNDHAPVRAAARRVRSTERSRAAATSDCIASSSCLVSARRISTARGEWGEAPPAPTSVLGERAA
jgi:hypothetical protein